MFGEEYIYILIDPKQPNFLKIGYRECNQVLKKEELIFGYEAGMEIAFCGIVKNARIFSNKINNALREKALGLNIKKDMFCISTDKCINIINTLYGKFFEQSTNSRFIPEATESFIKLREERLKIKSWQRIGEFKNDKIFISLPFEVSTTNIPTIWIMKVINFKKNPRTFGLKKFGSEISKVKFFLKEKKYECMYYSVFEKSMGTGELIFDDIVFPKISLNSLNVEAGHYNFVHDYLESRYITKINY